MDGESIMKFQAGVQYGDWKGSAALDDGDHNSIRKILRDRKIIDDDEFLIGWEIWVGEMHGTEVKTPSFSGYVIKADRFETVQKKLSARDKPIEVKRVSICLSMEEFLLLFKRISIAVQSRDIGFHGIDFEIVEDTDYEE